MTESTRPTSPPGCPDPERLASLLLGELADSERLELADHVVGCAACAADFRLLRELDLEARPKRRLTAGRVWGMALVAAAVVVVASTLSTPPHPGDTTRSPAVAVRPPDGAVLERAPETLSWPVQAGAGAYRVRLYRSDGTRLWESPRLEGPALDLPAEVRAQLASAGSSFWTIEIEGTAQRRRLGPYWFEVAPASE